MPRADLNGLHIHFQQAGEGPDVVLMHGFTSNLAIWMFTSIVPVLAKEFRVTSYDLRGHGLSDAPPGGYTSAEMAHDLHRLHDYLGLESAYYVGHSFGGVVAMHAARLHPKIVSGIILSDSYFPGLADLEPNMEHTEVWQELRETFRKAGLEIGATVDFARLFRIVKGLTPEQFESIQTEMGPPSSRWLGQIPQLVDTSAATDAFVAAGLTADELCRVEQPVVALYNEHSPFEATSRFLSERLPNCQLDIVPAAKHLALLENPDVFVAKVLGHLRSMVKQGAIEGEKSAPRDAQLGQPSTSSS